MRALGHGVVVGICSLLIACGVPETPGDGGMGGGTGGGNMGGGTGGGGSTGAPTITGQPQAQTATEGDMVTFTVTATGAEAWQWLRDGVDVSGATASSWTMPVVSLADDGAMISVRVSNATGSVTSDAVRLTINAKPVPVLKAGGTFTSPDGRVVLIVPPDGFTSDGTVIFRPTAALTLPTGGNLDELVALPSSTWQLELTGTSLAAGADLGVYIVPATMRDTVTEAPGNYVPVRQCSNGSTVAVFGDTDLDAGVGANSNLSCPDLETFVRIELRRYGPPPPPITTLQDTVGAVGFDVVHTVIGNARGGAIWWQQGGTNRSGGSGPLKLSLLRSNGSVRTTLDHEERLLAYNGAGWVAAARSDCHVITYSLVLRELMGADPQFDRHLRFDRTYGMQMGRCLFPMAFEFTAQGLETADQTQLEFITLDGVATAPLTPAGRVPRAIAVDRSDDSSWVAFSGSGTCVDGNCLTLAHYAPGGSQLSTVELSGVNGLRYDVTQTVRLALALDPMTGDAFLAAPVTERVNASDGSKVGRIAVMRVSRATGMLVWSTPMPESEGVAPTGLSVSKNGIVAVTTNYGQLSSGTQGVFAFRLKTDGTMPESATVLGPEGRPSSTFEALNNGGGWLDENDSVIQVGTTDGSTGSTATQGCDPSTPTGTPCTDVLVTRFRFP